LWLRETQCPGHTQNWYFQSCRYYLQNFLRLGRSVNSAKHQKSLRPLAEAQDCPGTSADESASGGSLRSLVSAREAAGLLQRWLTPTEHQLLDLLMDGHGIREIAGKLGMSHTSVVRYRRRIANLAARLGILPSPERSRQMHPLAG